MGRYALLVATGEYEDPRLSRLRAPAQDVERLAALLEDPDVGGFASVRVLRDAADHEIRRAVSRLVSGREPDDLVLLYFSCHGLTTAARRLYFAAANTDQDDLGGTALARSFVSEQLEDCRAGGRVLVLDCCFSGAFVEGFKGTGDVVEGGVGYVVLTASNAYEYAFEGDSDSLDSPHASLFTDVVIEGLASGAADLDGDGWVDVNELYSYASREVVRRRPGQTPQFFAQASGAALRVARAGGVPVVVRRSASYTAGQLLVARGFRAAAEPVVRTLGPMGRRSVVFVDGEPRELGKSAEIVAAFRADDPRDSLGASYVRDLVSRVHRECGDGGASAVAVAQGAISRLIEAMRGGHNPVRLLDGVVAAAERAVEVLDDVAVPLRDVDVRRLAESAGPVGNTVGWALEVVGAGGAVVVEEGVTDRAEFELGRGIRVESGYASALFCPEGGKLVLSDVRVLLLEGKLTELVLPLADNRGASGFVVFCTGLLDSVLRSLAARGGVAVVVDTSTLARLREVVGGHVLDGPLLRAADVSSLGLVDRVVVTERDTSVVTIREGGMEAALLRVPDVERAERAVLAVRSAAGPGVLRGAGLALREVGARLAEAPADGPAVRAGWLAFAGALGEPARWIAENSAVSVDELDTSLIDSAGVARVVVEAAARTAARFLLVA